MNPDQAIKVAGLEAIVGMSLDKDLAWEALLAAGSYMPCKFPEGNKRLALIGNAVLLLCGRLSCRERNLSPGRTTQQIQRFCQNAHLQGICEESGLIEYINKNPSQSGWVPPVVRSDTVDAVIGATFLSFASVDEGLRAAFDVVARLGIMDDAP